MGRIGRLLLIFSVSIAIRAIIALWGHSGQGVPPMFGDFEAQRHWLEVTVSLPVGDWYKHTTNNDLQYWGLDYPPLTAYVSLFFGKIAQQLCPDLVQFYESRGYEGVDGKTFMRASVIFMDFLVLIPVVLAMSKRIFTNWLDVPTSVLFTITCLFLPGLLLIDHGHFQYNGVCLGLSLLGSYFILKGHDIIGSVFFCLSLNFKQMSLYYAPVFFFCLLRKCFEKKGILAQLFGIIKLGITVIAVFAVLWAPFCMYHSAEDTCVSSLLQVLHRQFPFSRGIFEDKVANLWYSFSVIVDFRQYLSQPQLVQCSLALTLLLLTPSAINLLSNPLNTKRMLLALMNSSLAFFLASYQVHEKSVLLPLFPAVFLLPYEPVFITWFQIVGCFTMFPLLKKDKLQLPYIICCGIFVCLSILLSERVPPKTTVSCNGFIQLLHSRKLKYFVLGVSSLGMMTLHVMELFVKAPPRYPDLYPALFSIYGCGNLLFVYLIGIYWQFNCDDATVQKKKLN